MYANGGQKSEKGADVGGGRRAGDKFLSLCTADTVLDEATAVAGLVHRPRTGLFCLHIFLCGEKRLLFFSEQVTSVLISKKCINQRCIKYSAFEYKYKYK